MYLDWKSSSKRKKSSLDSALRNMSEIYRNTKQKERHPFAKALRDSGFKRDEARSYGYNISNDLWGSCVKDTGKRNIGGQSLLYYITIELSNKIVYI